MRSFIKSIFLSVVLCIYFQNETNAQQQFQLTQYQEVLSLYNPSFSGIDNFTDVRFGFRQQWTGFSDSPFTTYANISGVLPKYVPKKKRRRSKIKYKSPFDIEKLTDLVKLPNNGLRMSNPGLYRRFVRDSIRRAVKLLDVKAKAKLRKQLRAKNNVQYESKQGISVALLADQHGAFSNLAFNLGYSYHIPLSEKVMLAAGVSGILTNTSFDKNKAVVLDPTNDLVYQQYLAGNINKNALYINTGLVMYSSKFYLSYSLINVASKGLGSELDLSSQIADRQHNILSSVNIDINPNISISPGFMFISKTKSPSVLNINTKVFYQDKYWFGINYRNKDAIGASVGMMFNDKYKLTYSYDNPTSSIRGNGLGTHEIVFGILLSKGSAPNPVIR